ncbi:TATA box-binding protein-associated factor RNA polymerase I subunit B isoform X1 [Musca domestica]|uniref:TATA box-binding protein-associated factor RNA polymerase I subunit B n=1 Tax=Musca domestica TaxID=7370 RepID=A0ABM3VDM9_MUSDO|nr:TATA box-binding protein-associated factor RNA polymerase I subunit B isoform X1 [Musca domestica]
MEEEIITNITCTVCGETDFEQREGFYYCRECGTKQEQVRQVEVENDDDAFNETTTTKHTKTLKINVVKAEKPQLTSWECYNYILRGYVEELLSYGAKEELKLMALQVWAAYLRRMEVAFFNKKHADLPRLGVRYLANDAETIYNHAKQRKKRKRSSTKKNDTSVTSGGEEMSTRSWRQTKRKLNESIYSSATSMSSTSANTNKAIRLNFSMKARKILKKKMPVKHLLRHEMDSEGQLECHSQPKVKELKYQEYSVMVMSIKQIYSILAIALNLIGDDMQLTDLLRFIEEGRIGRKNILQYFPENIVAGGKGLLKKINFYKFPEKYKEKGFRFHTTLFAKNIGIKRFQTPDMIALVQRYVTELCLPQDIGIYAERLINFLPPQFATRTACYPAYEARAMAYIIFILKLFFGLDGQKEKRISQAAKKLNLKIQELNHRNRQNRPKLFVWDEWVKYIEMRKIIVSRFNTSFAKQFDQCQSTEQLLNEMEENIDHEEEQDRLSDEKEKYPMCKQKMESFKKLFESFLQNYKETMNTPKATSDFLTEHKIEFKPTLTPAHSYFKTILLHYDNYMSSSNVAPTSNSFQIPYFMRTDHSQRDINSYVEVKPLIEYFQNNHKELRVIRLEANPNRERVGIFKVPKQIYRRCRKQMACFDVSDADWKQKTKEELKVHTDDLNWKTEFESYQESVLKRIEEYNNSLAIQQSMDQREEAIASFENTSRVHNNVSYIKTNISDQHNSFSEIRSSHDVFSENNMDPLPADSDIATPRRNLGIIDIFANIEDEEALYYNNDPDSSQQETTDPIDSSTTDIHIKSEFIPENNADDLPEILKFYVSNMDCWLLFGNILMLTKGQLAQLKNKIPLSCMWLLETCAQTLGMEWSKVYEQLLVLEMMFCLGINDLESVKDCVYLKYKYPIKDYQVVITAHRDIW